MNNQSLHAIFERALTRALEQLAGSESKAALVDLYLMPNPESGEFAILDDEDHELVRVQVPGWQDDFDTSQMDAEMVHCEKLLREVVNQAYKNGLFDKINILKPFSVLMADEEMETIAELLLIDDEQYLVDDDFLKNMDKELDAFFEKLMADI